MLAEPEPITWNWSRFGDTEDTMGTPRALPCASSRQRQQQAGVSVPSPAILLTAGGIMCLWAGKCCLCL